MSATVANAKVVQHRATSYETTDDPAINIVSVYLKFHSNDSKGIQVTYGNYPTCSVKVSLKCIEVFALYCKLFVW